MELVNLEKRVRTGLVLGTAVIISGLLAAYTCFGRWIMLFVLMAGNLACAAEFAWISSGAGRERVKQLCLLVLAVAPSIAAVWGLRGSLFCQSGPAAAALLLWAGGATVAVQMLGLLLMAVLGRGSLNAAAKISAELFVGLFLISLGGTAWLMLPHLNGSVLYFFWLLLVVCSNDIAAYFVGSKAGGPKLCPALSPGKTISGSLAGLAGGLAGGLVGYYLFGFTWSGRALALISVAVVLAAQAGDLAKSFLKRLNEVKDSGSILPGHGGMLDRLDGLLSAAPVLCLFLVLVS